MVIDQELAGKLWALYDELRAGESDPIQHIQQSGVTDEHQRYVVADLVSVIPVLLDRAGHRHTRSQGIARRSAWVIDDDGRHVRRIGAFELVIASDSGGTGWWWRVSVGSEDIRTGGVSGSPYDARVVAETRAIVEDAAAECGIRVE